MGKQAAYAAAQLQMPTPRDEDEASAGQAAGFVRGDRADTEQGSVSGGNGRVDSDSESDASEEAKTDDEPDDLGAFERDNFMDAMRAENLFPPLTPDDVNVVPDIFSVSDESEEGDSAFYDIDPELEEFVDDVESDSEYEDEGENFQQDDDEMRGLEWEIFDQDHCGSGSFFAQAQDPKKRVEDLRDIVSRLERQKPIKAYEILHVIGLFTARTLCGHTDGLEKLWTVGEDGAVPWGTFGKYMTRDRFRMITRYLHFTSNLSHTTEKAFRVRPVLQVIEKTFRRGYCLGPAVSFDEGTIPNRSQYNPIRVYNKDKPHKYGTKCYMTCCADTGYCARVEVYLGAEPGKKKKQGSSQRAVIRNVLKTFDGQAKQRLVVADNFYSSPALALALLPLGFYYVGTQRSDRLGWPSDLMFPQKKRPQYMPRGTYRIAQYRQYPALVATAWMDSSPVHLISTGCSTAQTCVTRNDKRTGALTQVPYPQTTILRCVAFKKYYRQLFLAFVDMALVNGFILHKIIMKRKGKRVPTHAEYMRQLHVELLAVTAISFRTNRHAEDLASVPTGNRDHVLRSTSELYKAKSGKSKGKSKSRQFLCKVCSALSPPLSEELRDQILLSGMYRGSPRVHPLVQYGSASRSR
ncbi:hypothetical protein ON010_g16244 [Phytophthora cinnamomi]|nr:hypothetical protein ON010_g16244 [Phytophthora cinnamomi]